jgi:hypothetical protein
VAIETLGAGERSFSRYRVERMQRGLDCVDSRERFAAHVLGGSIPGSNLIP